MGLPGAGKTTLARELAPLIGAVHFEADAVRANICRDLGFSQPDRIEQARRMGWLCDQVVQSGGAAIADFICPTNETRAAFGECYTIFVDRIEKGRFEDTNALFQRPPTPNFTVPSEHGPRYWAERIAAEVTVEFVPQRPTALVIGRFQPFHEGHRELIVEAIRRTGQVCIGVRDTGESFSFHEIARRIELSMRDCHGRFSIQSLPNITDVFYGRDVGYNIERIDLDQATQQISASNIRGEAGL